MAHNKNGNKPELRVSQLIVQPVLLDAHDAPVMADPIVFTGNETGTAAENLAVWLSNLDAELAIAAFAPKETVPVDA